MTKKKQNKQGMESLLDLDGEVFPMDDGYWTKFEVSEVKPSDHQPHGIKYSLTLHNKDNERVLGYDNAHAVKLRRKKYSAKIITWDHKHKLDVVSAYEFQGPGQLVEDFWADVNKLLDGG